MGPVRNPWNPDHTAGASSSGSAAFVAAGVVPIAHANDGGGSIRIPASCNGLVGLKPTRGRLPLDKWMRRMPLRLVTNGVVTRSVRDTAAFYREVERFWRNRKLPPIGDVTRPGRRRLSIAVVTRSVCVNPARSAGGDAEDGCVARGTRSPRPAPRRAAGAGHFADDFLLYWSFLAFAMVRGGVRSATASTAPGWTI